MKFIYALVSCLLVFYAHADSPAAVKESDQSQLKVRAGKHDGFFRIVLEGPAGLLSSGEVTGKGRNVIVRFSGPDFTVLKENIKIPCRKEKNILTFALKNAGDMKAFSLDNPSRLVIDIYPGVNKTKEVRPKDYVEHKKNSRSKGNNPGAGSRRPVAQLSFFAAEAEASTVPHPVSEHSQDSRSVVASKTEAGGGGFIPGPYKEKWDLLNKENNPYKVIKDLSANKPEDAAQLGAYHFVYGEALTALKQYLAAVEHLRLAYIHAPNQELKELALLRRAEAYVELGFFYESKLNYSVFIKDFPSSAHIAKAHLGLANSLSETGSFAEAVGHYEKAGRGPEVLFNMANALQKLEKVEEAGKVYGSAMRADGSYPEKSPETYFLFAENMRMTGNPAGAKKLLSAIESGPYRDHARISRGLIAMEESDFQGAIEYFRSIIFSRNMKVKVRALFNLSLAYLKAGNLKESISTLEEIRKNYPDSSMYDEALLVLSKLYKQDGRTGESVSLLKELVYGNNPPKEAFTELEGILTETGEKTEAGKEGEIRFKDLWREVGHWMLDETRGDFLLKIAQRLKTEGKEYIQLCSWLADNASGQVKMTAATGLAEYYAGLGNAPAAEKYMLVIKETGKDRKEKEGLDAVHKIEARINHINKNNGAALKNLAALKEFDGGDLKLLGEIITELRRTGAGAQQAVALYEKMLNRAEAEAEDYILLADVLYDENEETALEYYRTAHEKNPDDEWTIYRIGLIVDMPETNEMFDKLQKGSSLISRAAKAKLQEINMLSKIEEVYQ